MADNNSQKPVTPYDIMRVLQANATFNVAQQGQPMSGQGPGITVHLGTPGSTQATSSTPIPQNAQEIKYEIARLKCLACMHKNNRRYEEALRTIEQAKEHILRLGSCPYGVDINLRAELACESSEIYFNEGKLREAKIAAIECCNILPSWFKGHYQFGKISIKEKDYTRAIEPFMNALRCLINNTHHETKVEILILLCPVISRLLHEQRKEVLQVIQALSQFKFPTRIWTSVVCNLSKKRQWLSVNLLLRVPNENSALAAATTLTEVNYMTALDETTENWKDWCESLVILMLKKGANVKHLWTDKCLSVLHSALSLGLQHGTIQLLRYLLSISTECEEKNEQDINGNTLLHAIALAKISDKRKKEWMQIFRQAGVDDKIQNLEGKLCTDFFTDTALEKQVSSQLNLQKGLAKMFNPEKGKNVKQRGQPVDLQKGMSKCFNAKTNPVPVKERCQEDKGISTRKQVNDKIISLKTAADKLRSDGKTKEATCEYHKAIQISKENDHVLNEYSKRIITDIYCSLAELMINSEHFKEGLVYATLLRVRTSQNNYKGFFLCGQAIVRLLKMGDKTHDYSEATQLLFWALNQEITNEARVDILLECALLFPIIGGKLTFLYEIYIPESLWSAVINRLVDIEEWESVFHILCCLPSFENIPVMIDINYSTLLNIASDDWRNWGEDLLIKLIESGSNLGHLRSHFRGVPEIHACLLLRLKYGTGQLLIWIVLEKKLVNIDAQDESGNTVLHLAAKQFAKLKSKEAAEILQFLVDTVGVDGRILNNKGQRYSDIVPKNYVLGVKSKPNVVHNRTKANKHNSTFTDIKKHAHTASVDAPAKCNTCEKDMNVSLSQGSTDEIEVAKILLRAYNRILERKHNTCLQNYRQKIEESASNLIEKAGKSEQTGTPKFWLLVINFIENYQRVTTNKNSTEVAKRLSLSAFLNSDCHEKNPEKRMCAVKSFVKCGAQIECNSGESPISVAVRKRELQIALYLVQNGGNIDKSLQIQKGDTILHAAMKLGMETGNFLYLEFFCNNVKTFDFKTVQNSQGDTLFHLAVQGKDTEFSLKTVKFLFDSMANPNLKNLQNCTAIQLLKPKDRRYQYTKLAAEKYPKANQSTQQKLKVNFPEVMLPLQETEGKNNLLAEANPVKSITSKISSLEIDPNQEMKPTGSQLECRKHVEQLIDEIEQVSKAQRIIDFGGEDDGSNLVEFMPETATNIDDNRALETYTPTEEIVIGDAEQATEATNDNSCSSEISLDEFENLEWEVDCTVDVWRVLRRKDISYNVKTQIISKIKLLASGDWRPKLHKPLEGVPVDIKLFEARLDKKIRILWQLTVAFSSRRSETGEKRLGEDTEETVGNVGGRIYSEIIRVWDIVFDHDNISRSKDRIVKSIIRGEACIIQKNLKGITKKEFTKDRGTSIRIPMIFTELVKDEKDGETETAKEIFFPPATANETEFHIMKFYSFSSSLVSTVLSQTDSQVDFPFRVTELEHAIITLRPKPQCAIILLGRSGTGKTTCCLYRMWTSFINYWRHAVVAGPLVPRDAYFVHREIDDSANEPAYFEEPASETSTSTLNVAPQAIQCNQIGHLHQVFITKNPVLCSAVEKNFEDLCHGEKSASIFLENKRSLPNRFQDIKDEAFPIFLNSKMFLMMLDASLPHPYFFSRNEDGSFEKRFHGWNTETSEFLINLNDDMSDVESDEDLTDDEQDLQKEEIQQNVKTDNRREVTYAIFAEIIWPKISQKTSFCQPSLVWEEVNSFIKGSAEALSTSTGALNLEQYQEIGRKRAPNFSDDRTEIYQLFQKYQRFSTQNGFFDEADVVYNLFKRMTPIQRPSFFIDQIFVDETQDFTQAELSLLIRCCQDPNQMFLTGDTAQNIMRGISFRFEDLKTLFYDANRTMKAIGKQAHGVGVPKKVYQLRHNYRSHAGILNLASSVVDLMSRFFPESFDSLKRDQGLFSGHKPILLQSCNFEDLALILRSNKRETSQIEFGAHQAILVANDAARDNLPEALNLCLVLTIYEAKGLEFDDVLLYNFFKDSQACSKEWRIVTAYLEELSNKRDDTAVDYLTEIDIDTGFKCRAVQFDKHQHKVMISEFKNLYTAITRARANVWIFDEDEGKRGPMFEYFQARRFVEVVHAPDNSLDEGEVTGSLILVQSSAEDWKKRAHDFYRNKLYRIAAKAYAKAGDIKMETECLAHNRAQLAQKLYKGKNLRNEYLRIAERYLKCGKNDHAAKCLFNAREFKLAAKVFDKIGKYDTAARLFEKMGDNTSASGSYELALNYRKAVQLLCNIEESNARNLEDAIAVLERYEVMKEQYRTNQNVMHKLKLYSPLQKINTLLKQLAKVHYCNGHFHHMKTTLNRLSSVEDRLSFVRSRYEYKECVNFAVTTLKDVGRFQEAAGLLRSNGRFMEASDISQDTSFKAECILAAVRMEIIKNNFSKHNLYNDLQNAHNYFKEKQDSEGCAECKLLTAKYFVATGDNKNAISCVAEAYWLYKKSANAFGMMEAVDTSQTASNISVWFARQQVEAIGSALELHSALKSSKPSAFQLRMIASSLKHHSLVESSNREKFGYDVLLDEGARIVPLMEQVGVQSFLEKDICTNILTRCLERKIVCSLTPLNQYLMQQITSNTLCSAYATGFTCKELDVCKYLHAQQSNENLSTCLHSIVSLIMLENDLQKYGFQKQVPLDILNKKMLILLINAVFPKRGHSRIMTENTKAVFAMLRMIRFDAVVSCAEMCASEEWDKISELEKQSSTDKHIDRITTFYLLGMEIEDYKSKCLRPVEQRWENEAKRKYEPWKIPVKVGLKYIRGNSYTFLSFMRHLLNVFDYQHTRADIHEAIGQMNQFLDFLCYRPMSPILPTIANVARLTELHVTMCLTMHARHFNNERILLPAGYLAQVRLWDCMSRNQNSKFSLLSAVNAYIPDRRCKSELNGRIRHLIRIICGYAKPSFNVLADSFSSSCQEFINSGESERVLILSLVILCNIGVGLSFPPDCEQMIREALRDIDTHPNIRYPERLIKCLQKVQSAKGPRDYGKALKELLQERDDEFLYLWTWNVQKGFYYRKISDFRHMPSGFASYVEPKNVERKEVKSTEITDKPDEQLTEQKGRNVEEEFIDGSEAIDTGFSNSDLDAVKHDDKVTEEVVTSTDQATFQRMTSVEFTFFAECAIDDKMCGTCGVMFNVRRQVSVNEEIDTMFEGDTTTDGDENFSIGGEIESQHQEDSETMEEHTNSGKHQLKTNEFLRFKHTYDTCWKPIIDSVDSFLSQMSTVESGNDTLKELNSERELFYSALIDMKKKRRWEEVKALNDIKQKLEICFNTTKEAMENESVEQKKETLREEEEASDFQKVLDKVYVAGNNDDDDRYDEDTCALEITQKPRSRRQHKNENRRKSTKK